MNCQNQQEEQIKAQIRQKYPHLSLEEVNSCFNSAFKDFVFRLYPSRNNRPPVDKINLDFYDYQTIKDRMEEILDMVGGKNVVAYKENGISFQYNDSGYSVALADILPRASVPK